MRSWEQSGPQYDLSRGIELVRRQFLDDSRIGSGRPEAVSPSDYPTFDESQAGILAETAEELADSYMGGPRYQPVHYAVINQHAPSGSLEVVSNNWSGYFSNPHALREIAYLKRANPDTAFLVYDHLAAGGSPAFRPEKSRRMRQTGRCDEYAEAILEGIEGPLKDYDSVSHRGRSFGGLVALEMAALGARPVETVLTHDAVGSRPMAIWDLKQSFVDREGAHLKRYLEAATLDPTSRANQENTSSYLSTARMLGGLIRKHGLISQMWDMPHALAAGKLGESVRTALPHITGRLVMLSPFFSELNDPKDVSDMLRAAAVDTPHSCLVEQVLYNGTHAFACGTPAAQVAVEQQSLAAA